mmetsp:Transcript_37031/g.92172  ORF Transcript_37031/g.92172 Transcript_37031/m.92172 type:complete len:112 (+) Transcript_37031:37-372(+)
MWSAQLEDRFSPQNPRVMLGQADVPCAETALLLELLPAEMLLHIDSLIEEAFLPCYCATCRAFLDSTAPPASALPRVLVAQMLQTRLLVARAWDQRGFRSVAFPKSKQSKL